MNVGGGVKLCVEMHNANKSPCNKRTSKRERQKDRGRREREGGRVKRTKRQKEKLNGRIQSEHEMDSLVVSLMYDSLLVTLIMLYLGIR